MKQSMTLLDRVLTGLLAAGVWALVAVQAGSIPGSFAGQEPPGDEVAEAPATDERLQVIQASDIVGLDALVERAIRDRQRPQSIQGLDQYVKSIVRRCRVTGSVRGERISSANISC